MAVSEQLRVYLECNPSLKYQNLQKNSLGFKFSPHISFPEPPQSVCTGLVLCMTEICYFWYSNRDSSTVFTVLWDVSTNMYTCPSRSKPQREIIVGKFQTHSIPRAQFLLLFTEEINQGLPQMSLRAILFISFSYPVQAFEALAVSNIFEYNHLFSRQSNTTSKTSKKLEFANQRH